MKIRNFTIVMLTMTTFLLLTACGVKVVKGAAPIVRMNELSHANNTITLQLSMRNLNGVELDIQAIDFKLSVEGSEFFAYNGMAETNIVANGTETWSVEIVESPSSKLLLDKLQAGEIKSLPYSLEGSVIAIDEKKLRFNHEGHIYPVPGRPGRFR